jgi:hypothetical protein
MSNKPNFNQEQYDLLAKCSEKKAMSEWNEHVNSIGHIKFLERADFAGAYLQRADLRGADLRGADLEKADLQGAFLEGANLRGADLQGENLSMLDLRIASLVEANLSKSDITGASLYGTSCDDWNIDGIKCDYIFWDNYGKDRTPKNRNFEPGEFEALYKSLPEITYYFSDDFTPITPLVMDKVVNEINQKNPQFELKLNSFHSRGQPHAVFTVLHKEHADNALHEITNGYEKTILKLEGKVEILKEIISGAVDRPQLIQNDGTIIQNTGSIDHMGHTFGDIKSGGATNIATDNATMTVQNTEISIVKNDFETLTAMLAQYKVSQEDIDQLEGAIAEDQEAPEHKDKSFGKNVGQWFSNMSMKAGSAAWRIGEGAAAGLLANALKAYYGWA